MQFNEFKVPEIRYSDSLNPALWNGDRLRMEVRYKLLTIAHHFLKFINAGNLELKDVTLSGSNASYGYTESSDIDLHLVVKDPPEAFKELFNAKKNNYNHEHNITIHGIDVELYVQPASDPHHSSGIYSVLDDKWINKPEHSKPNVDSRSVRAKALNYSSKINQALKSDDLYFVKEVWNDIKRIRQAGLEQGGEYSVENLAFKLLRTKGRVQKLHKHMKKLESDRLSLEDLHR